MRFDEEQGSWRHSFLLSARPVGFEACPRHKAIAVRGIYSDALYKPWACARLAAPERWLRSSTMPTVNAADLSVAEFERRFEKANMPVVIKGLASSWPAVGGWTPAELERRFGDRVFEAGGFQMPMKRYIRYAAAVKDDQPLYLFDKKAMDTAPELLREYSVPAMFTEDRDCFSVLGEARPSRRWLIVGPDRSGSTFHKDPNATCAWNAVLHGRKRWIMYPPDQQPPGVHASIDGAEVAAPMALTEWLLDFYGAAASQRAREAAKRSKLADGTRPGPGGSEAGPVYPVECTAEPGDVVFVPRGWWHTAINIGTTVAITQNYVPVSGAWASWRFMRDKPEQVSGVPEEQSPRMAELFEAGLRSRRPEVWAAVEEQEAAVAALRRARSRIDVAGSWLQATAQVHPTGGDSAAAGIGAAAAAAAAACGGAGAASGSADASCSSSSSASALPSPFGTTGSECASMGFSLGGSGGVPTFVDASPFG
jgi:hypothetical protein